MITAGVLYAINGSTQMRKRHYLKAAFVGGQLITGRHKAAIQDSLVMIDNGGIIYAGE